MNLYLIKPSRVPVICNNCVGSSLSVAVSRLFWTCVCARVCKPDANCGGFSPELDSMDGGMAPIGSKRCQVFCTNTHTNKPTHSGLVHATLSGALPGPVEGGRLSRARPWASNRSIRDEPVAVVSERRSKREIRVTSQPSSGTSFAAARLLCVPDSLGPICANRRAPRAPALKPAYWHTSRLLI